MNLTQKKTALISNISALKSVLIAYSGGVDSTLLLKISHDVLKDRVVAVTVASALQPGHEKNAATQQAKSMGVQHIIIAGRAMDNTEFVKNDKDRCYHCKKFLFHDLLSMADELGLAHVAHGANTDDLNDYRPGYRAANELGIVAPLLDACLNKQDIRDLSRQLNLSTWDKPAMACLASRIPYGTRLTGKRLKMVDAAEDVLLKEGFQSCRVRHHGDVARIEVPETAVTRFLDSALRKKVVDKIGKIGFSYVTVDLAGYAQGSMNRSIKG